MKVIIGLDGGSTKSHIAIFSPDGTCLSAKAMGALNHEVLPGSDKEFEAVFPAFVLDALHDAGASTQDVAFGVFGMSGMDTAAQHHWGFDILRKMGLKSFKLCNDSFLGVAAGCPNGIGICAINGSGFVMSAIDDGGQTLQVGGVGDITGDCGGSYWYVTQAISAVYAELFKLGRPTVMRDMLFELVGISDKNCYVDTFSERLGNRSLDMKAATCIVFDAAMAGDLVAVDILERSAAQYAGGISYLADAMNFKADDKLFVTLTGSVFVKQHTRILPQMIENRVKNALGFRDIEFLLPHAPPVAGAVLWAARSIGYSMDISAIHRSLVDAELV